MHKWHGPAWPGPTRAHTTLYGTAPRCTAAHAPCHTVLCRIVPCRAVLCRAVPSRAVPCRAVLCRAAPRRISPYRAAPRRTVLCRAVPHRTVPCCATPHRTVLCRTAPHGTARQLGGVLVALMLIGVVFRWWLRTPIYKQWGYAKCQYACPLAFLPACLLLWWWLRSPIHKQSMQING